MTTQRTLLLAAIGNGLMLSIILYTFHQLSFLQGLWFYILLILCGLLLCVGNYFMIKYIINYVVKQQLQDFKYISPMGTQEQEAIRYIPKNLEELQAQISGYHEQNINQFDFMKQMEDYRKEYLGNVSHELKTPLFSIQGYAESLLDGAADVPNLRQKYLERIQFSTDRMMHIIQELDQLNRYETGEIQLKKSHFDINAVVLSVFDLFDLEAREINAHLQLHSDQQCQMVYADQDKITQVLINLLSNAIHYVNRDQAKIDVYCQSFGGQILVKVIDNGVGIPPEKINRIFERFYRVDSGRSRKNGGSGLGLSIVKHILEAHQKSISVQSEYLEGACFAFYLDAVTVD
jgi:signal transduction histidine kinase